MGIDLEIVLEVSERSGWRWIALDALFLVVLGGLTPNLNSRILSKFFLLLSRPLERLDCPGQF